MLAAAIVLSVMIYPTITSVSADAIRSVNQKYIEGAYGLGSTRWQMIYKVLLPAAMSGILTAIVLGLARAFGEALAVSMVIGKMRAFPKSLLDPTNNLTSAIAPIWAALWTAVNSMQPCGPWHSCSLSFPFFSF